MKDEFLAQIWSNIEYYRQVKGLKQQDVYRVERYGKGISINSLIQISEILDIPVILLFESYESKEITREVAWSIVCSELKLTPKEIINMKILVKSIEKLINKSKK